MNPLLYLRQRRRAPSGVEINVISLIDILFVLLVFFMVTSSFTADTSIDIERPGASRVQASDPSGTLLVALSAAGEVVLGNGAVSGDAVPAIHRALAENRATRVLLVADRLVPTGRMLEIMDACTAAGAEHVDLAAQAREAP
jgi:biopolymer transport protein ExbD